MKLELSVSTPGIRENLPLQGLLCLRCTETSILTSVLGAAFFFLKLQSVSGPSAANNPALYVVGKKWATAAGSNLERRLKGTSVSDPAGA